jgi:hypothetical protein
MAKERGTLHPIESHPALLAGRARRWTHELESGTAATAFDDLTGDTDGETSELTQGTVLRIGRPGESGYVLVNLWDDATTLSHLYHVPYGSTIMLPVDGSVPISLLDPARDTAVELLEVF